MTAASGAWWAFDAAMDALPQTRPATDGNLVELLVDGPAAFAVMHEAIALAGESIEYETYEFDGEAARQMTDALIGRAEAGVRVRVLLDEEFERVSIGRQCGERLRSFARSSEHLDFLVQSHNMFLGAIGVAFGGRGSRALINHRKGLIVDGRVGFIGGMNTADRYASGAWHDMHARVRGPAVGDLRWHFMRHWREIDGGADLPTVHAPPPAAGRQAGDNCRIVAHTPGEDENIRRMYREAIDASRWSIRVACPYFTDPSIMEALFRAGRRGVDVRLIWPACNDMFVAQQAARTWYPRLLAAGCKVFEYGAVTSNLSGGRMAHQKIAVFDDKVATIGSSNLDPVSLTGDHEHNLLVIDRDGWPRFAAALAGAFDADLRASCEVVEVAWLYHAPSRSDRDDAPMGIASYDGPDLARLDAGSFSGGRLVALTHGQQIINDGGAAPDWNRGDRLASYTGSGHGVEELIEPRGGGIAVAGRYDRSFPVG